MTQNPITKRQLIEKLEQLTVPDDAFVVATVDEDYGYRPDWPTYEVKI